MKGAPPFNIPTTTGSVSEFSNLASNFFAMVVQIDSMSSQSNNLLPTKIFLSIVFFSVLKKEIPINIIQKLVRFCVSSFTTKGSSLFSL